MNEQMSSTGPSGNRHRQTRRRRRQASLLLVPAIPLLLAGCSVGPDARDPVAEVTAVQHRVAVRQRLIDPIVGLPAGVTAMARTADGRVFVSFARTTRGPSLQVAEVLGDGSLRPYPSGGWNAWDGQPGPSALRAIVNAAALQVDREGYLWILDSGRPAGAPSAILAGPKLFRMDPSDGSIAQLYYFDHQRELGAYSSLSDLAVDPDAGFAYISDAGRGAIYVVNLRTREGRTVMLGHHSALAEGEPLSGRDAYGEAGRHLSAVALSQDRQWLYYHARGGRALFRVPTKALQDARIGHGAWDARVERVAETGGGIERILADDRGQLYLASPQRGEVLICRPGGQMETFVAQAAPRWPAAMVLGSQGDLFFAGAGEGGESLLRVVVDQVERAMVARQAADQARLQAAEAASAAEQVRRDAQLQWETAEARQREAEEKADQVQHLDALNEQALAFSREAARMVVEASEARTLAAAEAERAAARAHAAAAEATEAAQLAQIAAEEARRRAEEARRKLTLTSEARAEVQRQEALAEAAAEAHQKALAEQASAEQRVYQLQALRQQRLEESAAALAAAEAAEAKALAAREAVQRFLDTAHAAERIAIAALDRLEAAEQGQVGLAGRPSVDLESTASVPVD